MGVSAQSDFFELGEKDSYGAIEFMPKIYLDAWDQKGSDKFIRVSAGIYKTGDTNTFYGVYVEYDSALVKKDWVFAIVTKTSSYLLKECNTSRASNLPFAGIYIPYTNPAYFYDFLKTAEVTKLSFSKTYFIPSSNPNYFRQVFKDIRVKALYFDWYQ